MAGSVPLSASRFPKQRPFPLHADRPLSLPTRESPPSSSHSFRPGLQGQRLKGFTSLCSNPWPHAAIAALSPHRDPPWRTGAAGETGLPLRGHRTPRRGGGTARCVPSPMGYWPLDSASLDCGPVGQSSQGRPSSRALSRSPEHRKPGPEAGEFRHQRGKHTGGASGGACDRSPVCGINSTDRNGHACTQTLYDLCRGRGPATTVLSGRKDVGKDVRSN